MTTTDDLMTALLYGQYQIARARRKRFPDAPRFGYRYDDPMDIAGASRLLGAGGGYYGLRVIQSPDAQADRVPFVKLSFPPPSRHRSKRVMKKLLKRSAIATTVGTPCIYITSNGFMLVHPSLMPGLRQQSVLR